MTCTFIECLEHKKEYISLFRSESSIETPKEVDVP
jgi:hypothetical protein